MKAAKLWLALLLGSVPAAAQEPEGRFDRAALADSVSRAIGEAGSSLAAGEAEKAVGGYRRAEAFLGLDILYGDAGDPDRLSAAIARGLAEAYLALGDPYAAAVEAERGTALEPDDARLWALLGLARHRLADIAGATTALERAVALDGREADAHWGLGLVAIARNRPREAIASAERALALRAEPSYALAIARWSELIGDYGRATDALDRWLEMRPEDPDREGYRNLRRFYALLGRAPTASLDPRITRIQLGFDLKAGDEIPYVPVRLNGRGPVYVLFDTGAERNVLDRAYAEEIGLEPILPGGRLHGAYRPSPGGYTIVDSLTVGSATLSRVPFAVGDFGALTLRGQGAYYIAAVVNPALLFRDFLVALDYGHRRIELIRYGAGAETYLARPSLRRSRAPFVLDVNGVWPIVKARLDGSRELPLLVDTGASDLLIGRQAAGALRLDPARFAAALGDYRRDGLRGILLDGPPAETWGIAVQGILGYPFFRGSRLVFDYQGMTLVVEN